jgi:hypothetical protein
MKIKILAAAAIACISLSVGVANAAGCIKGAAVGGVAGHVAGHHGLAGAAIGCAVGHHRAKVKAKREEAQGTTTAPGTRAPSSDRVTRVNKSDI